MISIKTRFETLADSNLIKSETDGLTLENEIKSVVPISRLNNFEIQTEIGNKYSFLTSFTIGYINYINQNWNKAAFYLEKALHKNNYSNNSFLVNYYMGFSLIKLGKASESFNYLKESIKNHKGVSDSIILSWPYLLIGSIYSDKGDFDTAMKYYDSSRAFDPYSPYVYNNIGVIYARQKKFKIALNYYLKAFSIWPGDSTINRNSYYLGVKQKKLYDDKVKEYGNSSNPQLLYKALLARAYNYSLWEEYDNAINDYNNSLRIFSDSANPYIYRGNMYEMMNDNLNALKSYDSAIVKNNNSSSAYYERGLINKKMGLKIQALEDYTISIKLKPNAYAFNNRGNIYIELKKYHKALNDFTQALKLEPNDDFYKRQVNRAKKYL